MIAPLPIVLPKIISTIDFTSGTNTLTISKGISFSVNDKFIFKVVFNPLGTTLYDEYYSDDDFSTPDLDYNTDDLVIDLPVDEDGNILQGTYTLLYCKSSDGLRTTRGTITLTYCLTIPTVAVGLEYTCRTSTIVSTDNTNYDAYCSCTDAEITPSITRTHIVKYPTTMETPIADVTSSAAEVTITPIWTKYWVSRVTSYLSYRMPDECYTGDTSYYVVGTITGFDDKTVVCEDCLCLLFDCITVVINKYFEAKATLSPYDLQKYRDTLSDLQTLYMQYQIAEQCDTEEGVRDICGEMRAILAAWDCTCDTALNSEYSTQVIAVASSTGSSIGGTQILNGDGVPSESIGNTGDFYFDNLTGDVYKKTTGGWVEQFSMTLTALASNYIMHEVYTPVSTVSATHAQLGTMSFDKADLKDGTALVVDANLTLEEDTSSVTQVQLVFAGNTSSTDNFDIDTTNDGTSFTASIRMTYYIEDTAGTFYMVAKKAELIVNNVVVETTFTKGLAVEVKTSANAITLNAKTDGSKYISLDTIKIVQEQTNS